MTCDSGVFGTLVGVFEVRSGSGEMTDPAAGSWIVHAHSDRFPAIRTDRSSDTLTET